MTTTTRAFLRDFAAFKLQARTGETVRIKDKDAEYIFTASTKNRKTLLGAAKGEIFVCGDLTKPTLPDDAWRPSL